MHRDATAVAVACAVAARHARTQRSYALFASSQPGASPPTPPTPERLPGCKRKRVYRHPHPQIPRSHPWHSVQEFRDAPFDNPRCPVERCQESAYQVDRQGRTTEGGHACPPQATPVRLLFGVLAVLRALRERKTKTCPQTDIAKIHL